MTNSFLTDKQVSDRYEVSRGTVWRWTRTVEDFPTPVIIGENSTRWKLEELIAWEESRDRAA